MSFWDSSALVKLLAEEENSAAALKLFDAETQAGDELVVWWATRLEMVHASARRTRERALSEDAAVSVMEDLELLSGIWREVLPSQTVRDEAERLLKAHALRMADSLQLAAAIAFARYWRSAPSFVTYDKGLARVAGLEGFSVLAPA